jgi:DNA-binding MarR family transcriptional regulator
VAEARTVEAATLTRIVLTVFRANGLLLDAGDSLAAREGLTSASWQVLGALALAGRPLTVPQVARRMGLTRQSVHATVHRLVTEHLLELVANSDHRRSYLVQLTSEGTTKFTAIDTRQIHWSNRIAATMHQPSLETTARTLDELCAQLETDLTPSHEPATVSKEGRS